MGEWLQEINRLDIPSIADRLKLTRKRLNSYGPCPLCGAENRGKEDKRGPIGLTGNGRGAHCHACNEQMDIVDLVSIILAGKRVKSMAAGDWAAFRSSCESYGFVSPESGGSSRSRGSTKVTSLGSAVDAMLGKPSGQMPAARKERTIRSITSSQASGELAPEQPQNRGGGYEGRGFPWEPAIYEAAATTLWEPAGAHVLEYLRSRGYSDATLKEWKMGAFLLSEGERVLEEYLVIPVPDQNGRIVNYRFRSIPGPCLRCPPEALLPDCPSCKGSGGVKKKYRPCTGRPLPLFGSHLLSADRALPVIILEGELDVIAAWQFGYRDNVVTSTAGAGTWKEEWTDIVEPYDAFILGHDPDEAGSKGAEKVATQLGRYRCSRLILPEKDMGACLEKGIDPDVIERAMEIAKPMLGVALEKSDHYGSFLEDLIEQPDKLKGIPTKSPKLNEKLGGLRPGLTVVTGDTGSGKTTFGTWIAHGLARDGIGCMITSYEQRPVGTVQKLLRMELENDFTQKTRGERFDALKRLGELPLWILDHYGHMGFQEVLDSIRYARRRYAVRWFLIDHLGFLVGDDEEDERRAVEKVIRALALLAYTDDLMIWLICHPSNSYVQERRRVMLKDLKGASAIRQDVSDGIVVERGTVKKNTPWCHAIIHLDKVRSEFGQAGCSITMPFDPLALHYADSASNLPTYKGGGLAVDPGSLKE